MEVTSLLTIFSAEACRMNCAEMTQMPLHVVGSGGFPERLGDFVWDSSSIPCLKLKLLHFNY